jgi:vitamin B12 transporter
VNRALVRPARAALLALALTLAAVPSARADALVTVRGVVVDRAGQPVEYATVACPALRTGTAADDQGRFALELPPGRVTLEVTQLGHDRARVEVRVAPGLAALRVVLDDAPLALAEVQVATSAFGKAGTGEGATLRRMDVITTPGGAADVMQSLRALPGINAPNEGAAVYVRGGDPSETLIRLDGDEVGHPYHYEGASGGLFSALDAYLVRGAFFSSGGFSARYGRVLSGVLDIDTQDPGDARSMNVGLNMVGANLSGSLGLVPGRLGVIGSLRYSDTDVLMRVYGTSTEYVSAPVSHDAAAKLLWRPIASGRVTLTVLQNGDRSRLYANALNVYSLYHEDARNTLGALDVSDAVGEHFAWHLRGAWQRYRAAWTFSGFGTAREESDVQGALQAVWTPVPRHELTFGADVPRRAVRITGTLPADSVDIAEGAPLRSYDLRPVLTLPGAYVEDKLRLWGPLYATLGARVDRASNADVWTVDPRAALAWRVDDRQTVRVAAGRYHQPADARQLDATYGNPALGPLRADHLIAGYEWLSDVVNLRVETYRKDYRDLVTVDSLTFYANGGNGFARGVDVFLKGSHRWTSGWLSYGYLDSKRREGDDPRPLPAAQGVKHSLTLVGNYQWSGVWILGVRYGWSSGPPWTPVAGRVWDPARGIWRPVYAENRSGRMPAYHRLDVRATRLFSIPRAFGLPASAPCAAYIEGLNVLGIRNVLEYVYNSDWSRRSTRDSYFSRRMLVAGMSLTW